MHKIKMMNIHKLRLRLLHALTDETRLEIVSLLRHGEELCGCDLEKMIDKSQSTLSRHLKKLTDADIISARKEGVKVLYKIKDPHIYKLFANIDYLIKRNEKFQQIVEIQTNL
jgi:DNA-binding transcriptional ArsR family regulator